MNVFNLDSTKLNEVMYNMENQNKDSVIIISSGIIINPESEVEVNEEETYPLPEWGPVDGFRIMNEFVSNLKNPILKQELKDVLNHGHGVFRKFKNVLKSSPEVERIWYAYKKDEIKTKVLNWYNQIREYAGLELYSHDDIEEEKDYLDFDFYINNAKLEDNQFINSSDFLGFSELYNNYPNEVITEIYNKKREGLFTENMYDSDFIYVAKNASGERVGFVWATGFTLCDSFTGMDLLQLFVTPEYRGLGVGKLLLNKILDDYKSGCFNDLIVNCQGKNSWLLTYLELEGYKIEFQELTFRA